jgi:hypothetical protein
MKAYSLVVALFFAAMVTPFVPHLTTPAAAATSMVSAAPPIEVKGGGGRLDVGGRRRSFWVWADVSLSPDGSLFMTTTVETKEALAGFTGRALIVMRDADGNIVHTVMSPSRGVSGTVLPGPSRKRDVVRDHIDPAVAARVATITVIPWHSPQPVNLDAVKKALGALKSAL